MKSQGLGFATLRIEASDFYWGLCSQAVRSWVEG